MNGIAKRRSPQRIARAAGVLELIIGAAGIFGEAFVRSRLLVAGDPAATAENVVGSQLLLRTGTAAEMIMLICDVALAVVLYILLRPVSRVVALLAAFFRLAMSCVLGVNLVHQVAPLLLLSGSDSLTVFDETQLQALAMLSFRLHTYGSHIGLAFFGVHCLFLGWLIYASGFLPRFLGVLTFAACASYLTGSFAGILSPALAGTLFPMILLPAAVASWALTLWLLIKGVNVERWEARSQVSG